MVKRRLTFALLSGLILATCLLVIYREKPVQKTVARATSDASGDEAKPETTASTGGERSMDTSRAEIPAVESGWVNELRELRELAARDPETALRRVANLPDPHDRKSAARVVCLIVSDRDPARAMLAAWSQELGKFSEDVTENAALEKLARQWAEADLVKVFVWASALPADDEARRDRVVKGIASALAQVAPAEAANLIAKYIHPDSTVHADAAIEVLRVWAANEYAGAVAWAALFPAGPLRERSLEALAGVTPGRAPNAVP